MAPIVLPLGLVLLLLSSNRIRLGTPYWVHVVALRADIATRRPTDSVDVRQVLEAGDRPGG